MQFLMVSHIREKDSVKCISTSQTILRLCLEFNVNLNYN